MNNIEKSTGGQSGFTLVEVLIAMVVLAFGLLSIAGAFANGMVILVGTPVQLAAKEMAYEIIDDCIVRRDAGILTSAGEWSLTKEQITTKDARIFLADANITDWDDDGFTVDVTVYYCPGCGRNAPNPNGAGTRKYSVTATVE